MSMTGREQVRRAAAMAVVLVCLGCGDRPGPARGSRPSPAATLPPGDYTPREVPDSLPLAPEDVPAARRDALRRASVWRRPRTPIGQADLGPPAGGGLPPQAVVDCRFLLKGSDGRTPKFTCVRAGGDVLKVKYGHNNPEVFAEVAATRLFSALGFGADDVHLVARVRCFGCPPFPYPKAGILDALRMDEARIVEFDHVTIERRRPGLALGHGWGFDELDLADPRQGGATRAERDALRLLAALVGHWDAKPDNQRLLCEAPSAASGSCDAPLAYVHDLGQTFGPRSMDLEGWRNRPVWADQRTCTLSMRGMPYDGATFGEPRISEGGRARLASLLRQLRPAQLRALFQGARFPEYPRNSDEARNVDAWVRAFQDKVRQVEGARCSS